MADKEFIKYDVNVDVDGLRGVNYYKISALYNVVQPEGHATVESALIDEFEYTWDDIEKDGGIAKINQDLRDCYGGTQ